MLDKIVLELVSIFHILIWLFIVFGGFISSTYANLNIFYIIPGIYILHILSFHILNEIKLKLLNIEEDKNNNILSDDNNCVKQCKLNKELKSLNNSEDDSITFNHCIYECKKYKELDKVLEKYILPKILNNIKEYFKNSFSNPVSPQGLLILGFIINTSLIKYYWKTI
jgi:hypothetical protein